MPARRITLPPYREISSRMLRNRWNLIVGQPKILRAENPSTSGRLESRPLGCPRTGSPTG